jgi:hypothetical protein
LPYDRKLRFADDLIKHAIDSPKILQAQAKIYREVRGINKNFDEIFAQAMTERLENIKNPFELTINITWIESLRAELCIIGLTAPGKYIEELAERILFVNREQTMIFVIILYKLSNKLRSEDPKTFNKCVDYLKQLTMFLPTCDEFWEPNMLQIESELKKKIHRKQLEKFQFKIDDFSLERAKFIFKKAFEERDSISMALSRMSNSIGLRLLKVHLCILCEIYLIDKELEFDVINEENPTLTFLQLVGKFYEFHIIDSLAIFNILIGFKKISFLKKFCGDISKTARDANDTYFESTKKLIMQVCEELENCDGTGSRG